MTVNGFKYISAGCPALKEIVINDMPTLSDSCVLVSVIISHVTGFTQNHHHCSGMFNREIRQTLLFKRCDIFSPHTLNPLSLILFQQALLARCHCLSAMSLLEAPHLSDTALKAIAEVAKLKTFSTEGEIPLYLAAFISIYRCKDTTMF